VAGVISCNDGESALLLALAAAGVAGGEVIVPSYTFAGTPHAVRWAGATPAFADIANRAMTLDLSNAEYDNALNHYVCGAFDTGFQLDYLATKNRGEKLDRLWEAYSSEINRSVAEILI
jgi:hypothetical protein